MRILLITLCALLCGAQVDARPRHWYTDKQFWLGEAVIIGATVADAKTTCDGFHRGLVEGNPLDRGSHSCGATIGLLSIGTVVYSTLHIASYRMLQDDDSRRWRALSLVAVPAIACAFHCSAAIHNANLGPAR